jgi:hypothetical protein
LLALAFAFVPTGKLLADEVYLNVLQYGSDPTQSFHQTTTNGSSLSASFSGKYGSASGSSSYGRIQLDIDLVGDPNYSTFGYDSGGVTAHWIDTITINPADPALVGQSGTVRITYHLNSSISLSHCALYGPISYNLDVGPFGALGSYSSSGGMYSGSPMSDWTTFTVDMGMTFGTPLSFQSELLTSGNANPAYVYSSAVAHATLTSGNITVLDNSGNPVSYSSSSSIGASRGTTVTNGSSYAGFSATNNTGYQTSVALLGGTNLTAGSNEMVTFSFIANPDTNHCVSDAVDLSGVNTNIHVLQMSYNPADAVAKLGDAAKATLLSLNPITKTLANAVEENSDGGAAKQFFQGAFNVLTHFHLDYFGVDTNHSVVWAVLNHNSTFVVGRAVAPPVVQWTSIAPATNGGTSLTLNGPTNGHYIVEFSSDLGSTNWNVFGFTTLTNGVGTINDASPISVNQQRFYRARQ